MKIEVTQDDIDNGKRAHPQLCMVALAVARKLNLPNAFPYLSVGQDQVRVSLIGDFDRSEYYRLSRRTEKLILEWDHGENTKPFRFKLLKDHLA